MAHALNGPKAEAYSEQGQAAEKRSEQGGATRSSEVPGGSRSAGRDEEEDPAADTCAQQEVREKLEAAIAAATETVELGNEAGDLQVWLLPDAGQGYDQLFFKLEPQAHTGCRLQKYIEYLSTCGLQVQSVKICSCKEGRHTLPI